jgi:hypothetical protein
MAEMTRIEPRWLFHWRHSNSAIQIIRPLESIAEMQLQLYSGFAEIVSNDFPVLHGLQETFF